MRTSQYWPITWVRAKVKRKQCWFGYCGKTRGLYHIVTDDFLPLIIRDLIVDGNECEEAEGCLHQVCPLNKTTPQSYWKRHSFSGKPPKKLNGGFSNFMLPEEIESKSVIVTSHKNFGPLIAVEIERGAK